MLGLPDGRVWDVARGVPREARPDEFVSKRLGALPEPGEPAVWLQHLGEVFAAHPQTEDVIRWLRWWLRYSLGTSCTDESIVFLDGPAPERQSNAGGKLACGGRARMERFAEATGSRATGTQHKQWLAGLARARVVLVGELPQGWKMGRGELELAREWRDFGGEQDATGFDGIPIRVEAVDHRKPSAIGGGGLGFLAATAPTRMPIAT